MRVEVFLKNGHKLTIDEVYDIVEHSNMITFAYNRSVNNGDFTTCDVPDYTFDREQVDMVKCYFAGEMNQKIHVKASGGATKWGISNLDEIQKVDPNAKKTKDGHSVVLSDGRILKPGDTVSFE